MSHPFWTASTPLLLASTSAIRRTLLEAAGIPVDVEAPSIDERNIDAGARRSGAAGQAVAMLLAREKALAVSHRHPARLVLGADQTLACLGEIFDKPRDAAAARRQIAALAGRTHHLHSAAALARDNRIVAETISTASLTMRPMEPDFIARYVEAVGPSVTSTVGGYQLEGQGVQLFERIEGDYFAILGLPLLAVLANLRTEGCLLA